MTLKQKYQSEVKKIAGKIISSYAPEKIIVFGSCATGMVTHDSDIDMLIIKDVKKKRFVDRFVEVSKLTRDLDRVIPFEPIVMTPAEFRDKTKADNVFLKEIVSKGKVIYEKKPRARV